MLRWGLIGAGEIARVFSNGMRFTGSGRVMAVASQTAGKAERLGDAFGIPKRYTAYDDLLADPEIDAVYISTIHPFHAEWAIKAARGQAHSGGETDRHECARGGGHDRGGARSTTSS